jgi:predicted secreted Zn-dependent protease
MPVSGLNYKLSWDKDFPEENKLEMRPTGKKYDSETHPNWKFKYKLDSNQRRVFAKDIDITVSLDKKDNWVVRAKMLDELLRHEQGHYDITALLARDFDVSIKKISASSVDEIRKKVGNLEQEFKRKFNDIQISRYDKQTKHGADRSVQEMWEQRISAEKRKSDGSADNLP